MEGTESERRLVRTVVAATEAALAACDMLGKLDVRKLRGSVADTADDVDGDLSALAIEIEDESMTTLVRQLETHLRVDW